MKALTSFCLQAVQKKRTRTTNLALFFCIYLIFNYTPLVMPFTSNTQLQEYSLFTSVNASEPSISTPKGIWVSTSETIMGTNVDVQVWAKNTKSGDDAVKSVVEEMERINQLMSTYIPVSELSILNKTAYSQTVHVSQELFDLLLLAQDFQTLTLGAFDVTYASVGYLYEYAEAQKPTDK